MTKSNESKSAGSVPAGRIAGVAVLAGGIIALTVVAMSTQNRTIDTGDGETRQVANQTTPSQDDRAAQAEEQEIAQADLSPALMSPDLTRRLTMPTSPEEYNEAKAEFEQLQAQRRQQDQPPTNNEAQLAAQKQAILDNAAERVRAQNAKAQVPGSTAPGNPNALISFDTVLFDFGDLYSTNPVPGTFKFTSAGTEDLVIERVQTTCGCTSANAAELRNSRWEPGTGSAINFEFTPTANPGPQSKVIRVLTNSENNRVIELTFKANYIPAVKLSSQTANFGRVQAGNIGQSRIIVESRDPNFSFVDFDLGAAADQFTWNYSQLEAVDEQYPSRGQLLIQTRPDAMIGPMSRIIGNLTAKAAEGDAANQVEMSFNVVMRGEIIGQIEVEPRLARAPLAEVGAAFEHTFTVKSPKGQAFKITDIKLVEGDAQGFTYEVQPVDGSAGAAYSVTVRGNAPQRAGGYMGQVAIHTDIENHGPMPFQFTGVTRAVRR
jgi:hypothetical protein